MKTLADVMSTELLTVSPDATVAEVAQLMSLRHVGSALVLGDAGALEGIFTERDIVRALAADFGAAGNAVATTMTRSPETLAPDASTAEALDLMLERGFRHIPVVEGDRVLGVVSLRDLAPR
jgi:CBS domain-containing protein